MVYTLSVTHRIREPLVDGGKLTVELDNTALERLNTSECTMVKVKNAYVSYDRNDTRLIDKRLHTPIHIRSNSLIPNLIKHTPTRYKTTLQKKHTPIKGFINDKHLDFLITQLQNTIYTDRPLYTQLSATTTVMEHKHNYEEMVATMHATNQEIIREYEKLNSFSHRVANGNGLDPDEIPDFDSLRHKHITRFLVQN